MDKKAIKHSMYSDCFRFGFVLFWIAIFSGSPYLAIAGALLCVVGLYLQIFG